MSIPSTLPNQSPPRTQSDDYIPKKQQWALINQYKALQFQRLKQAQKMMQMQKKRLLKQQLDYQLSNKNGAHQQQKQQDRRYYEYITKKSQEMKERQEQQKYNKFIKRRQVQSENQYHLDHLRNSRGKDNDTGYHLDIGIKSQMQRRQMQEYNKKQMLDTLDKQLQIKADQRKRQKLHSLQADQANLKYQYDQFDRRKSQGRRFGQNQNVYKHYMYLQEQKKQRQRQLEQKIVDEAAAKKQEEQDYKRYIKQKQKNLLTNQMKNTLDLQIDLAHRKIQQQKRVNPQEHTYSVIGSMFKQRQSPYNKLQYSQYLKKQAEQNQAKKKKEQYMSEQQYRINMNQLNRAVSGSYAYQKYIDRSIGSIGDNRKVNMTQMNDRVHDQDADVVKTKLEMIKNRDVRRFGANDSYIY